MKKSATCFTVLLTAALHLTTAHADIVNGSLTLSEQGETLDYVNQGYSTADGLTISFSFSVWGSYISDGFTLALFDDATATPDAGGKGGSLGYANRYATTPGLAGAVLGIGFDAHGNFSEASEGRIGGIGRTPNSIALRGSMGSSRTNGYAYIAGTGSLPGFMNDDRAETEAEAVTRDVRISISADETVSVEWKLQEDQNWTTLLDAVDASGQMDLTEQVKVGFTASLNDSTTIQINSLTVIPEPAAITLILTAATSLLFVRRLVVR